MANRDDWGLWLFFAGIGLGFVLMLFVVGGETSSFYLNHVAPTQYEVMRPLGYVLDAGILLAFAMTVAGIACFSFGPPPAEAAASANAPQERGGAMRLRDRHDRHRPKPRQPPAPHGST